MRVAAIQHEYVLEYLAWKGRDGCRGVELRAQTSLLFSSDCDLRRMSPAKARDLRFRDLCARTPQCRACLWFLLLLVYAEMVHVVAVNDSVRRRVPLDEFGVICTKLQFDTRSVSASELRSLEADARFVS